MIEKLKNRSIKSTIIIWFLLISLVPVVVILSFGYNSNKNNILSDMEAQLNYIAPLNINFINDWFKYREADINNWSSSKTTSEFTKILIQKMKSTDMRIDEFVISNEYKSITDQYKNDYIQIQTTYDYIYDMFIIDNDGNIIFTVLKEDDFGKNINSKELASTKFSKIFNNTLIDKKTYFSDFERYSPSSDEVFAFFTAPIYDNGNQIGVFAVQLTSDPIVENFQISSDNNKINSYLVGKDGFLRSKINFDDDNSEVLRRKIDTHIYEHTSELVYSHKYIGPNLNKVYGTHSEIDILGVKWIYICELDEKIYLQSIQDVIKKVMYILLFTTLIIMIIAFYVSRYITRPIVELSKASMLIAHGNEQVDLKVDSENEIGQLANSLTLMVDSLKQRELQLVQQSKLAQMGEMISMIAHQWRQPLAAISSTVINLRMKLELDNFNLDDKEEQKECKKYFDSSLSNIEGFSKILSSTIDDFRNFHQPNKDKSSSKIEVPVQKALKIVRASFESEKVKILESYNSKKEVDIYDGEFMQVVLNILKNSLDNFKDKQIKDKTISIDVKDTKSGVRIDICDNGSGIKDEIIYRIFEPYFSTKTAKNGTGLGLYMCKTIIEEHHNGKIGVKNIDNGVCFFIEINS